ncbi:MAG TPA: CbtB domain-containing protein [Burkholderiales bacterium]|nr:CbtB domain-containing protein [Burkholderiales bacterium]
MRLAMTSSEKLDGGVGVRARTGLWPVVAAIALGFAVLYVVGFAGPAAIHDAAHDTRHSLNFPCH